MILHGLQNSGQLQLMDIAYPNGSPTTRKATLCSFALSSIVSASCTRLYTFTTSSASRDLSVQSEKLCCVTCSNCDPKTDSYHLHKFSVSNQHLLAIKFFLQSKPQLTTFSAALVVGQEGCRLPAFLSEQATTKCMLPNRLFGRSLQPPVP